MKRLVQRLVSRVIHSLEIKVPKPRRDKKERQGRKTRKTHSKAEALRAFLAPYRCDSRHLLFNGLVTRDARANLNTSFFLIVDILRRLS